MRTITLSRESAQDNIVDDMVSILRYVEDDPNENRR